MIYSVTAVMFLKCNEHYYMYTVHDIYSWPTVAMKGEGGPPILKLQAVQYSSVFTEQTLG